MIWDGSSFHLGNSDSRIPDTVVMFRQTPCSQESESNREALGHVTRLASQQEMELTPWAFGSRNLSAQEVLK